MALRWRPVRRSSSTCSARAAETRGEPPDHHCSLRGQSKQRTGTLEAELDACQSPGIASGQAFPLEVLKEPAQERLPRGSESSFPLGGKAARVWVLAVPVPA